MLIIKYLFSSIFIYLLLLFTTAYLYFDTFANNIIKQESVQRDLEFNNFYEKVKPHILNNQLKDTNLLLDRLVSSNKYKYVRLSYVHYYLTNKSIILHSDKKIDMSWQLNDISIDASQGTILPFSTTVSVIVLKDSTLATKDLYIKAQAENQITTLNIISTINYTLPNYINEVENKNNFLTQKLIDYLKLENEPRLKTLYIYNNEFANILYKYNNDYIYHTIKQEIKLFLIYYSSLFIFLLLVFFFINYYVMQNTTNKYLKMLKNYTKDILDNNFYKFDSEKLVYDDIKDISIDISKISKKMATIINELNVNRNQLELKVSTDGLTGLPNNKIFEAEIKNLFLNKIDSYLVKIKLLCMINFSNTHTINETNNLILSFVNKINTIISSDSKYSMMLFRIYGSEFTLIAKNISFEDMNKFLNILSNEIILIKDEFNIKTKIAHLCSLPLDTYSSTQIILNKLDATFNKTVNIPKQISFYNEDNKKLNSKNEQLSKVVTSIIKNSAFTLSYKYDTYEYNNDKLVLKEVSPNLIDLDGKNIPIGTFISVASDLKQAIDFDKDVVEKTFKFIQNSNIDYKLAINLSIDSIKDDNFITWLESKLLYDYSDTKNSVVFSITSFAAKNNFDDFLNFTNNLKRFDGHIILKRFNFNDLSFDQLEKVSLDYIRVHSDYTDVLNKQKQNILRNISDFCIANNIKLYADMVSSENTHQVLKSINFDGASKEVKN